MAVRPIRIYGDPVLREKARPVETIDEEIRRLAEDMLETLADAEGVGLAGPQVGASQRVIVVHPAAERGERREPPRVLVNPDIVDRRGPQVGAEEGCLSIPGIYDTVKRHDRVRVRALDLEGKEIEIDASGMLSRILQHEIDHLEGVLFVDRVGPMRRALLRRRLRELQD
jgi:peptide deformylase